MAANISHAERSELGSDLGSLDVRMSTQGPSPSSIDTSDTEVSAAGRTAADDNDDEEDLFNAYVSAVNTATAETSITSADNPASSREQSHPHHDLGVFSILLSLRDGQAMLDCRNFYKNVKGYPCNRARGFPHVLDLRRYFFLDNIDPNHEQHFLVDVAATILWFNKPEYVDNFAEIAAPGFEFRQSSFNKYDFSIRREAGLRTVTVLYLTDYPDLGDWSFEYSIGVDGRWHPVRCESSFMGILKKAASIEVAGMGLGRHLMRNVLSGNGQDIFKSTSVLTVTADD